MYIFFFGYSKNLYIMMYIIIFYYTLMAYSLDINPIENVLT